MCLQRLIILLRWKLFYLVFSGNRGYMFESLKKTCEFILIVTWFLFLLQSVAAVLPENPHWSSSRLNARNVLSKLYFCFIVEHFVCNHGLFVTRRLLDCNLDVGFKWVAEMHDENNSLISHCEVSTNIQPRFLPQCWCTIDLKLLLHSVIYSVLVMCLEPHAIC